MMRSTGVLVIIVGIALILIGLLIYSGALSWFGRLPGDIRFGNGRTQIFVPLASMLIVSLVLSLLMWLLRRFV